jgi:hypothetical protein
MTTEKTVRTRGELDVVLARVSFAPSCLALDWRWETKTMYALPEIDGSTTVVGWLVRTTFLRPDTATGEIGRGFGRWEFIAVGTSESGVVKTAWLLCELIVRHELMEAFLVDGIRIFDPHHTVADLSLPHRAREATR